MLGSNKLVGFSEGVSIAKGKNEVIFLVLPPRGRKEISAATTRVKASTNKGKWVINEVLELNDEKKDKDINKCKPSINFY